VRVVSTKRVDPKPAGNDRGEARPPAADTDERLPNPKWNEKQRDETETERLDRNFQDLLQELRVAQAGVQILFAFLLSLAFTQRFGVLTSLQRAIYIVSLLAAAAAAALFIGPVAWHRALFRLRRKHELVTVANRMALGGLIALLLSIAAAVLLVVDVTAGPLAAVVLTGLVTLWYVLLWYVLPLRSRSGAD
jgi:cation transport ATPase